MKLIGIFFCLFMLMACDNNPKNRQNIPVLKVQQSVVKGVYHISGTHSELADESRIAQVNYDVISLDTGDTIHSISSNDHHRQHNIFLPEGNYNVTMTIAFAENETDFDDAVDDSVRDDSTIFSDGEGYYSITLDDGCDVWCGEYNYSSLDNTILMACILTFEEDSCDATYSLPLYSDTGDDYLEHIVIGDVYSDEDVTEDTLFCLRAIGGAGTTGDSHSSAGDTGHGGSQGLGGFSQIITSRAELGSDDLYFLLGSYGGSSIVTTTDYSSSSFKPDDDTNLILVAGGGGSGAEGKVTSSIPISAYDGGDGGNGGVANADSGNCIYAKGGDGSHATDQDGDKTGYPADGGGTDESHGNCDSLTLYSFDYAVGGDGGSDDYDGNSFIGGIGGNSDSIWYNYASYTNSNSVTDEDGNLYNYGAGGDAARDAYGGGGVGGGGGGDEYSSGAGGGGGGGGSGIADKMAELDDDGDWCDDDVYQDALSGDNDYGLLDSQYGTIHFIYKIVPSSD